MFSNTLSFLSSRNVSDQVSHPYKTTGKIIVLYISIFKFLNSNLEDKRCFVSRASIPHVNVSNISALHYGTIISVNFTAQETLFVECPSQVNKHDLLIQTESRPLQLMYFCPQIFFTVQLLPALNMALSETNLPLLIQHINGRHDRRSSLLPCPPYPAHASESSKH